MNEPRAEARRGGSSSGTGARPRPGAVLFDLDMTLVETRVDLARSVNAIRTTYGLRPLPEPLIVSYIGHGLPTLLARGLGSAYAGRADEVLARFRDHYRDHCLDETHAYPGAVALLDALADVPVAIVSNKTRSFCTRVLDGTGFAGRFEVVIGGDTASSPKPDPAPLRLACEELGVAPSDAIMVGDSPTDVLAAHRAGCRSVAVTWGLGTEGALAHARPHETVATMEALRFALGGQVGRR